MTPRRQVCAVRLSAVAELCCAPAGSPALQLKCLLNSRNALSGHRRKRSTLPYFVCCNRSSLESILEKPSLFIFHSGLLIYYTHKIHVVETFILALTRHWVTTENYTCLSFPTASFFLKQADADDGKWMNGWLKNFLVKVAKMGWNEKSLNLNSCNRCMFKYLKKAKKKFGCGPGESAKLKSVFSCLLFCLQVESEDRLHLYRRSRTGYIWLYYQSVRSGLFASSTGDFPCRKPSAERIQTVWIAAPPMHLYYLKKKKKYNVPRGGKRGGAGRKHSCLFFLQASPSVASH